MLLGRRAVLALIVCVALAVSASPATSAGRTTITAQPSSTAAPVGRTVTVAGVVRPRAAGRPVVLQRYSAGSWRRVSATRLTGASRYSFSVRLAGRGVSSYRVIVPRSGSRPAAASPVVRLTALSGFASVTLGWGHGCSVKHDRTLWCWGSNLEGQLGLGRSVRFQQRPARVGTASWLSVSAGVFGTCGVRSDRTLWCWGSFDLGQGNSSTPIAGSTADRFTPVRIGDLARWATVSTGGAGVCGLRVDRTAACWTRYQAEEAATTPLVAQMQPFADWSSLEVGTWSYRPCGIRSDRRVWCLDTGGFDPPRIAAGGAWTTVSPGFGHICGVRTDASMWCWGSDTGGATGPYPTTDEPQRFDRASWRTVAAGRETTCALATAGSLWCWGSNESGRLGIGSTTPEQSTTALRVGRASDWTSVALSWFGCGTRRDGSLWCWGGVTAPGDDPANAPLHLAPVRMG